MKRLIHITIVLLALQAQALDTTEEYSQGLSDFEAYSIKNSSEDILTLVTGYGYSRWLNPSLAIHNLHDKGEGEAHVDVILGNFSQLYSKGVDIDLLAEASLNSEVTQATLGTEVTYPWARWTPYVKGSLDFEGNESTSCGAVGVGWNLNSHVEILTELSFDLGRGRQEHTAVGLNFKQSQNIEFISEVGHSTEDEGVFASLGLIWTRN